MQCPTCFVENRSALSYCEHCGAQLHRTCPACAASASPSALYCGQCGTALGEDQGAAPLAPISAQASGERKFATVMFADVVNSTTLVDGLDAEEAVGVLDPVIQAMVGCIHRFGGQVNSIQGDGIMAIFSVTGSHEHHASCACLAALMIVEQVSELLHRTDAVRVGLHSGEYFARSVRNDFSRSYDFSGPEVHLAKRIEEAASPGTVCCTSTTAHLARGLIRVRDLGRHNLRGIAEAVDLFQPLEAINPQGGALAAHDHADAPLVGRMDELARLWDVLEQARSGAGQVVTICGMPGVGKSRLARAYSDHALADGARVLRTATAPYGQTVSYLPLRGIVKGVMGAAGSVDDLPTREGLSAYLGRIAPDEPELLAPLLTVLDLAPDDPGWTILDAHSRRKRITAAICRLLRSAAEDAPLLLIVEDLHWSDPETEAVLNGLCLEIASAAIVMALTHRPEYRCQWMDRDNVHRVDVSPLGQDMANALVRHLVGDAPAIEPVVRSLRLKTQGVPLFIEESIRTLVETGVLSGEAGNYRQAKPFDELALPATVQAVLSARVDRLSHPQRDLLQKAAVIGLTVPGQLLQDLSDRDEAGQAELLRELEDAEMLYRTGPASDGELAFKHAFTHEAVYRGILRDRRKQLHGQLVRAIERRYAARGDAFVEALAQHARVAEMWPEAAVYLRRAGEKAIEKYTYETAIHYLQLGLEAIDKLPECRETRQQAIDIRLALRVAIGVTGDYQLWYKYLTEAEELATIDGDTWRLSQVVTSKTHVLSVVGKAQDAIASGQRATELVRSGSDSTEEANAHWLSANYFLAQAYEFRGEFENTISVLTRALPLLQGRWRTARFGTTATNSVLYYSLLGYANGFLGRFDVAAEMLGEAEAITAELDRPFDRVLNRFIGGTVDLLRGQHDSAIVQLEDGISDAEANHIGLLWAPMMARLGYGLACAGEPGRGRHLADRALERSSLMPHMHDWCLVLHGLVALRAGEHETAGQSGIAGLRLARKHGYQAIETMALWLLGQVWRPESAHSVQRAKRLLQRSITLGEELGLEPLRSRAEGELGRLQSVAAPEAPGLRQGQGAYAQAGLADAGEGAVARSSAWR